MIDEKNVLREFAIALYNLPHSLSCDFCSKEKCKKDRCGGISSKSCVECIEDYWKNLINEKTEGGQ